MPLQASTPLAHEGKIYPYYALHLALSPLWQQTSVGGSVAMRLVPYRIAEDGTYEYLQDQSRSVVFLDVFPEAAKDPQLASAVNGIMSSIQQYILDKGI
jgi:hypothetical protein